MQGRHAGQPAAESDQALSQTAPAAVGAPSSVQLQSFEAALAAPDFADALVPAGAQLHDTAQATVGGQSANESQHLPDAAANQNFASSRDEAQLAGPPHEASQTAAAPADDSAEASGEPTAHQVSLLASAECAPERTPEASEDVARHVVDSWHAVNGVPPLAVSEASDGAAGSAMAPVTPEQSVHDAATAVSTAEVRQT